MKGSYQDSMPHMLLKPRKFKAFKTKLEIGADAAAADYQYCSDCLQEVSDFQGYSYSPQDTYFGYITTPAGYFSDEDYKLYRDRAKEDCALCLAHKSGTHKNLSTAMKDFLPPIVK